MATFLDLQNQIAFDLLGINSAASTGFQAQIKSEINRVLNKRRYDLNWFNNQISETTTFENVDHYELPPDFVSVLEPVILKIDNSNRRRLVKTTIGWVSEKNSYTGIPIWYTIFDNKLRIAPTPSGQYVIRFYFIKDLGRLSLDTDTNDWLTNAFDLIRFECDKSLAILPLRQMDLANNIMPLFMSEQKAYQEQCINYLDSRSILPEE